MTSEAGDIYREYILDLYKNPHNFGILENATHKHEEFNQMCGDKIKVFLDIKEGKVKDIKFDGEGCAISMASASLITDKVKNMPAEQIKDLGSQFVLDLMRIPIGTSRMKCALLPLEAIKRALN
ncbi:iron-sulfur cluster assembly scaffold protein [Candidatus Pacearchaeota archaeon]|nr:iron-sulfur cluster assembly scaffold protein [Candidatus Pacearchaeota archaeon]